MDPTCRRLHFVGTTGVIGVLLLAPVMPPILLAGPLVGYGFAWAGHMLFEKNRPATFTYPLWSLMADFVMYKKILFGQMQGELDKVQAMIDNGTVSWEEPEAVTVH